jgi:hypothetical protein
MAAVRELLCQSEAAVPDSLLFLCALQHIQVTTGGFFKKSTDLRGSNPGGSTRTGISNQNSLQVRRLPYT